MPFFIFDNTHYFSDTYIKKSWGKWSNLNVKTSCRMSSFGSNCCSDNELIFFSLNLTFLILKMRELNYIGEFYKCTAKLKKAHLRSSIYILPLTGNYTFFIVYPSYIYPSIYIIFGVFLSKSQISVYLPLNTSACSNWDH